MAWTRRAFLHTTAAAGVGISAEREAELLAARHARG